MFVFALVCTNLCHLYFCNHLKEEERVGCFAYIVSRMSCYCISSVALTRGTAVWYFLIILTYYLLQIYHVDLFHHKFSYAKRANQYVITYTQMELFTYMVKVDFFFLT